MNWKCITNKIMNVDPNTGNVNIAGNISVYGCHHITIFKIRGDHM